MLKKSWTWWVTFLFCLAIAISYVYAFIGKFNPVALEVLAGLLLMAGALLVAKGVVLKDDLRKRLIELSEKEFDFYARKADVLELKIKFLASLQAPSAHEISELKDANGLLAKINASTPQYLGQRSLARLLVESSDQTGAGTVLVVAGTLLLILKALLSAHPS